MRHDHSYYSKHLRAFFFFALIVISSTGCSLFFGTVKVDERSDRYSVMDLAKKDPTHWTKLEREVGENSAGSSDYTYQSKETGAIFSANSSCRGAPESAERSDKEQLLQALRAQNKLLMLGIARVRPKTERQITVADEIALESTIEGKMGDQSIQMRSVVLRKGRCQYDLIFIAHPSEFAKNEELFSEFVASLVIH